MENASFIIQIHGGAWDIPEELKAPHQHGVWAAYEKAAAFLRQGCEPLKVVVEALATMEDDGIFDAGKGSFLNEHGEVELDAGIMEGNNLKAGAVAGLGGFANPARIALAVLEHTEHVLLVGKGAESFASQHGFVRVEPASLVHPRELAAFEAWVAAGRPDAKVFFAKREKQRVGAVPEQRGTVGVVLGTKNGAGGYDLFAGTSTGGTPGKRAGRVGDVPLVGCGFYADNESAAVSCTGWGEGLMRMAMAKTVSEYVRSGLHPQQAVEKALRELFRRTGGRGGIIAIDRQGLTGAAYTTPAMAYAGSRSVQIDMQTGLAPL